jgi:dTDP-4-amino-4,6-dideoxygalactose transaminase
MIGGFGDAEVFSFHATKCLNTFEGGAVATNDDALAAKIRLMKNFGFAGYDNVTYIGTNGKMSEIAAAMGLTGLESLDEFIAINYQNYREYQRHLKGIPGIRLLLYDETQKCNYQYVVLEIDEAITRVSRDQLVGILHAENVLARRYFYPGCHRMEPYRSYFPHASLLLPETERLVSSVLQLCTGTAVRKREIAQICQILELVAENGAEVKRRMGRGNTD